MMLRLPGEFDGMAHFKKCKLYLDSSNVALLVAAAAQNEIEWVGS